MRDPKHIALTGASGGLGQALAKVWAAPGRRLSLAGRDLERLAAAAETCRARGAIVETAAFDLRDGQALTDWLKKADELQPLDLVAANGGVTAGPDESRLEKPEDLDRILEVDAQAAIRTAAVAAELMLPRGRGQIVLISSVAALYPLRYSPAYCAAKAAVRLYGLSIRGWLAPRGVEATVVCPGYVDTPMSRQFDGPRPMTWPADQAALHIVRRLAANPAQISFPWPLVFGTRLLTLMPESLANFFIQHFDFHIKPEARPDHLR